MRLFHATFLACVNVKKLLLKATEIDQTFYSFVPDN